MNKPFEKQTKYRCPYCNADLDDEDMYAKLFGCPDCAGVIAKTKMEDSIWMGVVETVIKEELYEEDGKWEVVE